jgi:hypothetical protein
MNRPRRHHYLPVFYLKRWADPSGRVVEFSRPYGNVVKPRRVYPAGTGFVEHLYSHTDHSNQPAPVLEDGLFKPVDSKAAYALKLLEQNAAPSAWKSDVRQAWAMFMTSLLMRMPADIEMLKARYSADWTVATPEQQASYMVSRKPDDPPTVEDYFRSFSSSVVANHALDIIPKLIGMKDTTLFLMNMHWFVLEASKSGHALITSDRPLLRSPLKSPDAFWQLPIGPHRMFWAVHEPKWEMYLRQNIQRDWVRIANEGLLRRATRYAFSNTDAPLRFVQQQLAKETLPSIFLNALGGERTTAPPIETASKDSDG